MDGHQSDGNDRVPISAVLITRDAASRIGPCLAALRFCDEILVVDSGSSDDTVELARRAGARVMHADWRGFGAQKQYAVEQASHDWVLCVDADEMVSERLQIQIRSMLLGPRFIAYRCARCNRFMGRYLRHGEGYPDWSLRVFDRRHARWSDDEVHEKVLVSGAVGQLPGDLLHDSAECLDDYLAKQNRYTTLAANAALARGETAGMGRLLLSPLFRFVKFYFLRLGVLDGVPGLIHIAIGCQNSFIKYAKMRAFRAGEQ